jgi:hypothetical protein
LRRETHRERRDSEPGGRGYDAGTTLDARVRRIAAGVAVVLVLEVAARRENLRGDCEIT